MSYRRPYIESSVFIEYIVGDNPSRVEIVQSIVDAAEAGTCVIVTSAWTIAEVHKRKRFSATELSEDQSRDILAYFRESYIDLVEIDRLVGERAHELCRTYLPNGVDKSLKPGDALHIAAAEEGKCDAILSYDPDFLNLKYETIPIEEPTLVPKVVPKAGEIEATQEKLFAPEIPEEK